MDRIGKRIQGDLEFLVYKAAENVANRAKKSIQTGKKTGRVYTTEVDLPKSGDEPPEAGWWLAPNGRWLPMKYRNKPHQASAPGEAPATDTGELVNAIWWEKVVSDLVGISARIGSPLDKSEYLESGTRYMEARPFLEPALKAEMPELMRRLDHLIRGAME